jgi:hypothetical protein
MSPYPPERGYDAKNSPMPDGRVNIPTLSQHLSRLIGKNPKTDKKPLSLWITEIGWFSARNLPYAKPEPAQATALARMYLLARRHRTAEAIFWYDLRDDGTKPDDKEHNFGLIRNDYSLKPAYVAAAVLTATLGDRPWKTALHETSLAHIHQYGEGGNAVIAGWTVYSPASEVLHIKPAPGKYLLRDWQGHDKTVEIPVTGYDWRLYPLPQYLVRDQ